MVFSKVVIILKPEINTNGIVKNVNINYMLYAMHGTRNATKRMRIKMNRTSYLRGNHNLTQKNMKKCDIGSIKCFSQVATYH